ncbi:flagellar filament capping protein FliD [Sporomusa sp.]|uniref:flagellar filament capping protein FliD n=1 Tax=Sporomusa sp. TaxID=2078658 RepID=UPI002C14C19D|nr:flagellar filament capping protein FliD [Sporomusa sp.]HWR07943.1 flagellar filament capping protein FliD [Sporomusa sp.]
MASSSGTVTTTTVNGTTRLTGLSSGIDVDSIVEQLMTAEKTKLNRLNQQAQLIEWKQEAYRDVISDIQTFTDKYFNVTSSSSIMRASTFKAYSVTSSSSAVTASYTSAATTGSHTVAVSHLATAATMKTSTRLSGDIVGTAAAGYTAAAGKSFVITVDGTDYTVDLGDDVAAAADIQTAIDNTVGEGKILVSEDESGVLTIAAADNSGVQAVSISDANSNSALSSLGLEDGMSNRIDTSSTLEELAGTMASSFDFDSDGQVIMSINGVGFSFDKDTTLDEMITEINDSDAGVTMKYDELSDQLILTADQTGAGNTLKVTETGSSFLTAALGTTTAGTDAKLTVDGVSLTRSSNTVTVDGITYTLNKETATGDEATVNIAQDTDAVYSNITSFVDAYNELISNLNSLLSEEYDSDYPPLTDDEKSEMSEDEITSWETKAKTGLLAGDTTLRKFLRNMRNALIDSVAGLSTSITEIGITTGTYDEQGKLYVDEDKLKEALQSDSAGVMNLFTQASASYPGTTTVRSMNASQRATRYSEEGLGYRIYDILQDNISTLRDTSGNKGLLIQKAGVENDASDSSNVLSEQLEKLQERITKEEDRLDAKEDSLYDKYTTLETYISTMNAQLSALSSYLTSSSS